MKMQVVPPQVGFSGRNSLHSRTAREGDTRVNEGARLSGEGKTRAKRARTSGEAVVQAVPAPISLQFLCPHPPLLFSAPNQNRHATQATLRLATL